MSAAQWAERSQRSISAVTGEGIAALLDAIDARLGHADAIVEVLIPAHEGRLVNWLYEESEVLAREDLETGEVKAKVRIAAEKKERLNAQARRAGAALTAL